MTRDEIAPSTTTTWRAVSSIRIPTPAIRWPAALLWRRWRFEEDDVINANRSAPNAHGSAGAWRSIRKCAISASAA